MPSPEEQRVLLRTATVKDAHSTSDVLGRAGFTPLVCASMAQLIDELEGGAGALLLVEEVLSTQDAGQLAQALHAQPAWSDLPVLLLARQGADSPAVQRLMEQLPNVTVIERPMRVAALVSALRSTLRARRKQYETRALLADLREADRRKTEFLATLAHELRNPLAPLSAGLELLDRRDMLDAAEQTRLHEMMRRQVRHMAALIDDLMEVSRVTRGKIELQRGPVALQAVLRDAIEQCRPLISAAGHELTVVQAPQPLVVQGDLKRLVQIVSNLLNNAAKYTPKAGHIRVSLAQQGERAQLQVHDDGIGLAPEMLERAFDMFAQASPAGGRTQGGLGIGLTLVRNLVELHGGQVQAASAGLGQGATFTVTLPLVHELPAHAAAAAAPSRASAAAELQHRRVLVVDDNRDAANGLALLLRSARADVSTAYSAEEALEQLARQPAPWDAAVLDIGLPGMDGCALARHLRRSPGGTSMRLIALTGWGQPQDRERVMAAGFDHHLVKPADMAALLALLRDHGGG